jgi:hypothetical protein
MVPETPPSEIVLDRDSGQIISASASDQLIATQFVYVWTGRSFVCRACGGAEWRYVDFELGRSARNDVFRIIVRQNAVL